MMKKRGSNTFLLLILFSFCSVHAVMEEKFEPFKPKEKIEKPTSGEDAYKLEERLKETDEEFRRTREEFKKDFGDREITEEDIKVAIDKRKGQLEIVGKFHKEARSLQESITKLEQAVEKFKQMEEAREYLNEPAIEKALQDFKAELTTGFEPVKPQEPEPAKKEETAKEKEAEQEAAKKQLEEEVKREDMPLGMGLWDALSLWYQKTKVVVLEIFGFKERALEIRSKIDALLKDVGSSGLLEKARNNIKRMRVIETIEKKLAAGEQALQELKKSVDQGLATKDQIRDEVTELANDLLALRLEVDISKVTERGQLEKSIDSILESLGMSPEDRQKLLDQVLEAARQKIEKLQNQIIEAKNEVAQWIKDDEKFKQYREKLKALVEENIAHLPIEEQGRVNLTIRDGFSEPVGALLTEIVNPTVKDRAALLDRFFSLYPDYVRSEKRVNDWYIKYAQDEGAPASGLKDVLSSSYAQAVIGKNIKPVVEAVIKNMGNEELQSAYRELDRRMAIYVDFLKEKPVSEGSLNSLVTLIDAYGKVIDSIGKLSSVSEEQVGKVTNVFVEATDTVQKLIDDLQTAQVSTIGVSNNQPVITIPAPPPLPPAEVENNARKVVAQLPKGDLMQEMLNAKLKKATPNIKQKVEEGGLHSAFEKAMKQRGLLTPSEAGPETSEIDWD